MWPGERLPEVFYDSRSVEQEGHKRAVLHAKCIVVDDRWTLLSSANFTEAAHERHIEAGVVLDDPRTAERVRRQFQGLVEAGMLRPLRLHSRGGRGIDMRVGVNGMHCTVRTYCKHGVVGANSPAVGGRCAHRQPGNAKNRGWVWVELSLAQPKSASVHVRRVGLTCDREGTQIGRIAVEGK